MKFIADKVIDFNTENDLLGHKPYAQTLLEVIDTCDTPFTVGLYGEWGAGKSSIVNSASASLEKLSKKYFCFTYDAWKYSNDAFRRTFLLQLTATLGLDVKKNLSELFYLDETEEDAPRIIVHWPYLILFLLSGSIATALGFIYKGSLSALLQGGIITLLVAVIPLSKNLLIETKITRKRAALSLPEQFESIFSEIVGASCRGIDKTNRIYKYVVPRKDEQSYDRIVIVLDNLDRCQPDQVYEILTSFKGLIAGKRNVVAIIPVDDQALRRHLQESLFKNSDRQAEADEFLRKLVNLTISVKPLGGTDLYTFTGDIAAAHDLKFTPDTIDALSKDYASNPRRIIQVINNLIVELDYFSKCEGDPFVKENEALIAALAVVKAEWPKKYWQLQQNPSDLHSIINADHSQPLDGADSYIVSTSGIYASADLNTLDKLFRIRNLTQEIPTELIDAIGKRDEATVDKYAESPEFGASKIISSLLDQLDKAISRQSYRAGVVDSLQRIAFIVGRSDILLNEKRRIANHLRKIGNLELVLEHVADVDAVLKLLTDLHVGGMTLPLAKLRRKIASEYLNVDATKTTLEVGPKWQQFLIAVISTANENSDLSDLVSPFTKHFFLSTNLYLEKIVPSPAVAAKLINHDFIRRIIDNVKLPNDPWINDFVFCVKMKLVSPADLESYFAKRGLTFWPKAEANTQAQIESEVRQLESILEYCDRGIAEKPKPETTTYIGNFFTVRSITKTDKSIVALTPAQFVAGTNPDLVLRMMIGIYKITGNQIAVSDKIEQFGTWTKNPDAVLNAIQEVIGKIQYSGKPFDEYLLARAPITLVYAQIIFEILTKHDGDGKRFKDDALISLVKKLLNSKVIMENEESINIVNGVISTKQVGRVSGKLAQGLSSAEIAHLPSETRKLFFDSLTKGDRIFDFADDVHVLEELIATENKDYETAVSKVVLNRLTKDETFMSAVTILEKFKKYSPSLTAQVIPRLVEFSGSASDAARVDALLKKMQGE